MHTAQAAGATSAYDVAAPSFDAYRSLPSGVAAAVRAAALDAAGSPQPRVLDLGAGTGRIGRAFVAAGDDYVGVDLSSGMLNQFYMISATCGLVDALCFLALGGVFAEMMTGNLLLMALSIGTGSALGQSARYIPAIVAFSLGALIGGRLLGGPQKLQERRIGF
jgi:hypothetical protein